MTTKAGVWIDHYKAVIVLVTDGGEEVNKIDSRADRPFASAGGPSLKQPDRPEGLLAVPTRDRKFTNQLNKYYDNVLACLGEIEALLIIGPGEAKAELHKRLKGKKRRAHIVELKTSNKQTDRQIAASVRQRFDK